MSLFSFRVPREYFNVTHDVMRMACIQIVVQFLFSLVNATENPFFSVMFLQTIAFVVIGVLFYWLVVRYLVRVDTDIAQPADESYSPATYQPHEPWTNRADDDSHIDPHRHPPSHSTSNQDEEEPTPPPSTSTSKRSADPTAVHT